MESKESILNRWFLYKDPKDLSLLEALGKISEGKLLAKILQNLPKEQLLLICRTSKYIKSICDKYELIDRLYAGELYVFGSGITIPKKIFKNVIQVSCGSGYLAFVTNSNDVYIYKHKELNSMPVKINNIPKVKQVSSGFDSIVVLTVSGDLYKIDSSTFTIQLKLLNRKAKKVHFSWMLPIEYITDDGDLYSFTSMYKENLVIFKNVKQISRNYSFVTEEGYYYFNVFGGVRRNFKVKEVHAGYILGSDQKHIKAIITNYDDFRIGYNTKNNDTDFKLIAENVLTADCGTENYAFVTKDGKLYTFGTGKQGNMGDGILEEHTIDEPFEVKNIPKVSQVSCGINYTAFITKSDFKLDINCQICGSVAKYHTDKHLFCGKECFNEFYSFDK